MNIDLALEKINKDPRMQRYVECYGRPFFYPKNDYFKSLVRSIVFQQLSTKVADVIYRRLIALFPSGKINPKRMLMINDEIIRKVGLSSQKVNYIKNLAEFFDNNIFNSSKVEKMSDKEIGLELIKIKGIGQWTIDMFLIFSLNRPDIMPYSDLGIQKGMKIAFNLNCLPTKNDMRCFSEKWKPFRTVACWYLWKIADDRV